MKKWLIRLFTLSLALSLFLAGCVRTEEKEVTGEKLDFTVVPAEDVPDELKTILEANKESEMMISYRIGEYLYIIRGTENRKREAAALLWTRCSLRRTVSIFPPRSWDRTQEKRSRRNPPVRMW